MTTEPIEGVGDALRLLAAAFPERRSLARFAEDDAVIEMWAEDLADFDDATVVAAARSLVRDAGEVSLGRLRRMCLLGRPIGDRVAANTAHDDRELVTADEATDFARQARMALLGGTET